MSRNSLSCLKWCTHFNHHHHIDFYSIHANLQTKFWLEPPHPYNSLNCFKQKVDYLLVHGPYKDLHASMKVSIFLNWLGDHLYELINTIDFPPTKSKSVLNNVIEQFDLYFKPSQNTFQSWYDLDLFTPRNLKMSDFLIKLIDLSKDCNLDNHMNLSSSCSLFIIEMLVYVKTCSRAWNLSPPYRLLVDNQVNRGYSNVEKLGQTFLLMLTNTVRMLMLSTEEDLNLKVLMVSKENHKIVVIAR